MYVGLPRGRGKETYGTIIIRNQRTFSVKSYNPSWTFECMKKNGNATVFSYMGDGFGA